MHRVHGLVIAMSLFCLAAMPWTAFADADGDGLGDADEVEVYASNPFDADSDDDDLSDGDEVFQFGSSPIDTDTDGDGLADGVEAHLHGTDPVAIDSDLDAFPDPLELTLGTSPSAAGSRPAFSGTAISAGNGHTCAVTSGGGVRCWGTNEAGQLGDGTTTPSALPVSVSGLSTGVVAIAAGYQHTCALTTGGGVLCWGSMLPAPSSVPVPVYGLASGVVAISAGHHHSCALTNEGGVVCWGGNDLGELGNGGTTSSGVPVPVSGLGSGVAAIDAGAGHTCAVTTAGAVYCWGGNGVGELGNGTTTGSVVPVPVSGLTSGVEAIDAGWGYTCAVTSAGGASCWGVNSYGQLGNGTMANSSAPVAVSGLGSGVEAIATSSEHTCALTSDGGVQCWGLNHLGQLGDGTTQDRAVPGPVSDLADGVRAISAGRTHSCALSTKGAIRCWGYNDVGQLGDGGVHQSRTPVSVSGLASGVVAIDAGYALGCALTASGGVWCWGDNFRGALGNDGPLQSGTPLPVSGLAAGTTAIAVGGAHACAIAGDGGVRCWGSNESGQLGNGSYVQQSSTPVPVSGLTSGVVALSAGVGHTCALTDAGGVVCWGRFELAEVGSEDPWNDVRIPVPVSGLSSGVVSIAAGGGFTCAVTSGGNVLCWGRMSPGNLVNGNVPVPIPGLGSGIAAVAAGSFHACALTTAGGVRCWGGWNQHGELGDGSHEFYFGAVAVSGLASGIASITAGAFHSCALGWGGAVRCWGSNEFGALGSSDVIESPVPLPPVAGFASGVVAIDAGSLHNCAITPSRGAKCWGSNEYGKLGVDSFTPSLTPVAVTGFENGGPPVEVPALGAGALLLLGATMLGTGARATALAGSRG